MSRFLADRSRNRYNAAEDRLEVSKIFDWFGGDFEGYLGHESVVDHLGDYAVQLSDDKIVQERIKGGE
ncbi:hypothetical protein [Malonomonas rubra]|uniref:hypothetical protein n=1 Tax=Malonomonas rubra TaxID=57040 RepID=UPI0034E97910